MRVNSLQGFLANTGQNSDRNTFPSWDVIAKKYKHGWLREIGVSYAPPTCSK
uniref:Uncharacterized protein n=1 Tax=Anguilla anguilla TaxID=7936 RepID=A0A0E9R6Y3_ANGAN